MSEQNMGRTNLSPGERMFEKIGETDEKYLQEAAEFGGGEMSAPGTAGSAQNAEGCKTKQPEIAENREKQENHKTQGEQSRKADRKKYRGGIIAVTVLAAAAAVLLLVFGGKRIPLGLSDEKVSVRNMTVPPVTLSSSSASLIELTEEEIFFGWGDIGETVIVRGTVTDIQNIIVDFDGDSAYRALIYVQAETVIRGDCQPGDVVTVLIPCPISDGFWVEDTGVISRVQVGMEGIFMLNRYDEESIWMQNGVTFYPIDIAEYGLLDGERFAFLQTDDGLVYSKWPYDNFEGFGKPQTLDEVEDYIRGVIE